MAKPPDAPDPDHQSVDYRERRFTWHEGDIEFVHPGDGVPLLTPEELKAAIAHQEPGRQAHREQITNVDFPEEEDIDYPATEGIPPAKPKP
jgi:hypothetical protein